MFRSNTQIHYFTHVLLQLGQSSATTTTGTLSGGGYCSEYCQYLTNMLIERAINRGAEPANMHLLMLVATDLSKMLHQVSLESPLAVKMCKNLALQVMHLLLDNKKS